MTLSPPIARGALSLVLTVIVASTFAPPTLAHAAVVLASPGPGIGLAQAPAAVVIKFTEPLNLELSRIEILDSNGREVGEGPTLAVQGDPNAMRRRLGLLPVGQYSVRWTTVSTLDGHILRGSYRFGVGTAASAGSETRDSPLDSEGPGGLLGRFGVLLGLALWAGFAVLRSTSERASLAPARLAMLRRAGPALTLAGMALSLASSALVATGTLTALGGVIASPSGLFRLGVFLAAGLGLLLGSRAPAAWATIGLLAIVAEAASGHAAASQLPLVAVGSFALHLTAAGVWVFAIVASLAAATDLRRALMTFTPYAVVAAGATALTGVLNAALALSGPDDLLGTGYGLAVLWKGVAFVLMSLFGFLHFRLRRHASNDERTLRGPVRAETGAALAAIALATLLTGFPNPPRQAEAAEQLSGTDPVMAQLGQRQALSVAGASGRFVVGLTLLPPTPGEVEVRVQLLGVDAGDGLRDATVSATRGGRSSTTTLDPCGLGCFTGRASLEGDGEWRINLQVASNRGPIAFSTIVPLPARDGTGELGRATSAMEGLQTAELDERLKGSADGPTVVTRYRFQAPDRMEISINETERIIIGQREYSRRDSETWDETSFPAPGFRWPGDYYREFWRGAAAVRALGIETVDGVPSTVIAFVRPDLPAWFRIWVGIDDGLIRRQEMFAEGHLMDHRYRSLNGPIRVEPPR